VRLAALARSDLVKLAIKGRDLYGEVTEIKNGFVLLPAAMPGRRLAPRNGQTGRWPLAQDRPSPQRRGR
jgi:hypothetical protein